MENKEVSLNPSFDEQPGTGEIISPMELTDKMAVLTSRVDDLTKAFNTMHSSLIKDHRKPSSIPSGTLLFGKSIKTPKESILVVTDDGLYIGQTKFNSLSAAAKKVSGIRRSGWSFWKTADGRTAKEAFNAEKT